LTHLFAMLVLDRPQPWYDRVLPWVAWSLAAAVIAGWLVYQVRNGFDLWLASRPEARGFEVKQYTGGDSPVLRRKEHDHG
jgi:hypothetical protein